MTLEITRRNFIKIAFGTISAAVLADPALANLLPKEAIDRDISPAYPLSIDESGYIFDPTHDYGLPTYREMLKDELELEGLPEDEQLARLGKWHGYDDPDDIPCYMAGLDDEVDPEWCSPQWLAEHSEWRAGIDLYESLDEQTAERLGLVLVDGEHPGVDFLAVKCADPATLQEALLREGINIEV